MAKFLRSLPISSIRTNLKPSSFIPITTILIPCSLSSLQFNHYPFFHFSRRTLCNNASVSATLNATEQQNRELNPIQSSAKETDLEWVSRTALCGHLGEDDVGKRVTLCGWVALHRVHGGLTFLNLRDHSGIVQVYFYFLCFFTG